MDSFIITRHKRLVMARVCAQDLAPTKDLYEQLIIIIKKTCVIHFKNKPEQWPIS